MCSGSHVVFPDWIVGAEPVIVHPGAGAGGAPPPLLLLLLLTPAINESLLSLCMGAT
jgi:hypothetical protein